MINDFWFVILIGVVSFVSGYVAAPWIGKMIAKVR